jgi:hypothetical protein
MDEAEVEHLVGLVEDEDLHSGNRERPPVDEVEQPTGRGNQNVDALRQRPLLASERDAAEHDGRRQPEVAAIGTETVRDLARQLTRRAQTRARQPRRCGWRASPASLCRIGSAKAAVLPVPVCAIPSRSRPAMTSGIDCSWMGVGWL